MSDKKNIRDEEVDLGSLFSLFSSVIRRIFNFFKDLFVSLINISISVLLFIKKHINKIVVVIIIGFVLGYIHDKTRTKQFQDNMIVQANYGAIHQLYQDVQYYQNLVNQEDSNKLSSIFNISVDEATSLKLFSIAPVRTNLNLLNSYNKFKLELDSLVAENFTLEMFKNQLSNTDYINHQIRVESEDARIFSQLTIPIINSIETGNRFVKRRNLNKERVALKNNFLRASLNSVDSLRLVYNKMLINNSSNKESSGGAVINLANTDQSSDELDLFNTESKIYNKLERLQIYQMDHSMDVIKVLSKFKSLGTEFYGFFEKPYLFFPLFCLAILFIFIGINSLNQYLNQYPQS